VATVMTISNVSATRDASDRDLVYYYSCAGNEKGFNEKSKVCCPGWLLSGGGETGVQQKWDSSQTQEPWFEPPSDHHHASCKPTWLHSSITPLRCQVAMHERFAWSRYGRLIGKKNGQRHRGKLCDRMAADSLRRNRTAVRPQALRRTVNFGRST